MTDNNTRNGNLVFLGIVVVTAAVLFLHDDQGRLRSASARITAAIAQSIATELVRNVSILQIGGRHDRMLPLCGPNDACDAGINRNANPNAAICRRIVRNIRPTLQ